jgi:hypothetical protein
MIAGDWQAHSPICQDSNLPLLSDIIDLLLKN